MNTPLRLGLFLFLAGAALAPLRASTLASGFGPVALAEGSPPVPGGCGRVTDHCSCAGDMGGATVSGGALDGAITLFTVINQGASSYSINGVTNPVLTLERGQTYTFNLSATGHPFFIKTVQGSGTGNAYNSGVTGNGTQAGTITFTVPFDAPSTLFYNCQFHPTMTAQINVIPEPSVLAAGGVLGLLAIATRRRARR